MDLLLVLTSVRVSTRRRGVKAPRTNRQREPASRPATKGMKALRGGRGATVPRVRRERIGRGLDRVTEALRAVRNESERIEGPGGDAPGARHHARDDVVEVRVVVDARDPRGVGRARVGEHRQGQPPGHDEGGREVAPRGLRPGRRHQLPHLLAQLLGGGRGGGERGGGGWGGGGGGDRRPAPGRARAAWSPAPAGPAGAARRAGARSSGAPTGWRARGSVAPG